MFPNLSLQPLPLLPQLLLLQQVQHQIIKIQLRPTQHKITTKVVKETVAVVVVVVVQVKIQGLMG